MIDALRSVDIKLQDAEWWFQRFTNAYRREIETEATAKASQK
ncbi:hypothetical protein [Oryzifoliimicrobium ureilyticus]